MSPDKSPRDTSSRLWSTKEGVGETSGQTAGSNFGRSFFQKKSELSKPVRQKKRVLLRSVRVSLTTRNFYRAERPGMKSGPDVFADALVPSGRIHPPGAPVPRSASPPERQSPGAPVPRSASLPERHLSRNVSFRRPRGPAPGATIPSIPMRPVRPSRIRIADVCRSLAASRGSSLNTTPGDAYRPRSMFAGKTLVRLP